MRRPTTPPGPPRARTHGNSLIEFAFILPILLLLALGVVDYGRAIQYENILSGMSRETANLSARTTALPDYIINAVASTAEPLNMGTSGMIYVTELVGRADGLGVVQAQYRLAGGDSSLQSRIYTCPAWSGTACAVPGNAAAVALPMTLTSGEIVHVAETAYTFTPLAGYVSSAPIPLYSLSML